MLILGIENKEDLKNMAAFWVFQIIEYTALALKIYNFQFVKVVYDNNNLRNFRNNFQAQRILKKKWSDKINNKFWKFGSTKLYVKDLIQIINTNDEWEQINRFCNGGVFFFIYDRIADTNSNPGYNQKKF